MSSWTLDNITAPDNYTAASTLDQLPVLDHVNIDVANGGIFWQLKLASGPTNPEAGSWDTEVRQNTGSRSLYRKGMVGIRIRAAVPAASLPAGAIQAQVNVEAVQ